MAGPRGSICFSSKGKLGVLLWWVSGQGGKKEEKAPASRLLIGEASEEGDPSHLPTYILFLLSLPPPGVDGPWSLGDFPGVRVGDVSRPVC